MPPVPFADFDFSFDMGVQPLLPDGLHVPSSASLFSPTETTTLLGFLDNFAFDFPGLESPHQQQQQQQPQTADPMQLHVHTHTHPAPMHEQQQQQQLQHIQTQVPESSASVSVSPPPTPASVAALKANGGGAASKKALTTPQKRLNHIMSEQKRRNAIRDGYATLTQMLAPAGTTVANALPRRGRPRGSGARGKGCGKGKSGVLFRAVEYIAWLNENCSALEDEIARLESLPATR